MTKEFINNVCVSVIDAEMLAYAEKAIYTQIVFYKNKWVVPQKL